MRPRKNVILFSENEVTISLTRLLLQTRYACKVHIAGSTEMANRIFSRLAAAGREVHVVLIDGSLTEIAYRMRISRQIPVVVFGAIPAVSEYMANYTVPNGPKEFSYRLLEAVRLACKQRTGPKIIRPVKNVPIVARFAA